MNKIEITELSEKKFDVWFNGENMNISPDSLTIAKCANLLSRCLKFILSKVI